MAQSRIDVFGGLRVSVDGVALPSLPSRPSGLLALLVLARCRPVAAGELIDWLWGENASPSAGNQIQRLVGQLRRQLDPSLEMRSAGEVILGAGGGYQLAETVESDLFDLDRQLAEPSVAADQRQATLRAICQRPFAGLEPVLADHPWYVGVERQCAGVALDALDAGGIGGPDRDTVDLVQAVASRFPFEERLQAGLVRALGAVGRRSEALALYDRVRISLRDELGIDPGPDLQAAHQTTLALDRPNAASAAPGPAQLPRVVGGLVARPEAQRQLDRIAEAGEAGSVLVTAIGGMGGNGKTTLAVAWAHQIAPRFPDGQLYLNLRGFDAQNDVMTTTEAVATLLTTLNVAPADSDGGLEAQSALLRSRLAGGRYLLLLDNARDAEHVRPLLPGDPGCLAIITSRDRLASLVAREGAVPIQLDRMSDEEAEGLLVRRLGGGVVHADWAATQSVLRACDGLPLALGLVATRIALEPRLTLSDIARELQGTDLTAWSAEVGSVDLRTVFAWSFGALDEAAVNAFQLLGAHPVTRMSMASMVSLLGGEPARCARTIRQLCDASLLQQLDLQHFGMHDLLRAYARAMPDPDHEVRAAEQRLVSHFVHTARNIGIAHGLSHNRPADAVPGGVVPETFTGPTAAHDWCANENEAAAAVTALAIRRGWTRDAANLNFDIATVAAGRGKYAQRLFEILAAAGGLESDDAFGDRALLADVLRAIAYHQRWYGTTEQAQSFLVRAERLVAALGDPLAMAAVQRAVGTLHENQGEYEAAQAAFERGLSLAKGDDGAAIRVRLYSSLANLNESQGNWAASVEANDNAIAAELQWRTTGEMLIIAHINRAEGLLRLNRVSEALQAIDASRAAGADASAYLASLLALEAEGALRAGDYVLARQAADGFHQYLDDHRAERPGVEWSGGIDMLLAQVDEVERALSSRG